MSDTDNLIEMSIWYDANDCTDPISACRETIQEAVWQVCNTNNLVAGETKYEILAPDDERVPEVPRWLGSVEGVVPRVLVSRTSVVAKIIGSPCGLVGDLDEKDLMKLRSIVRKAYRQRHPGAPRLTDPECDSTIDKFGMDVVLEQLRNGVVH